MLRGLAEFVMAGRKQAVLAIVLLGLPPLVNLLTPALVAMYMLLIFPTMMYLLILVAIVDSWYDFRARVPKSS